MKEVDAVIFDMDGVLIDSEPIYMDHVLNFYKMHGIEVDPKEVAKLAGSSNETSWEMMAKWWNKPISPKELEVYYETNYCEKEVDFLSIINPYVKDILTKLKAENIKLAIASSSPMSLIKQVVEQCDLEDYFDCIVSGHDFKESKPNPEIYLHTMSKLKTCEKNTIIIEDSTYGIQAGNRANALVIALKDDRFYYDQTTADYLVNDLKSAYRLITELRG